MKGYRNQHEGGHRRDQEPVQRPVRFHTFSGQSAALQELNAEWIVEDFEENGGLVPFANFGTVTFTGASATTNSGTVGPSGADIIDIRQNNKVLTDVTVSGSSVTVKYVG